MVFQARVWELMVKLSLMPYLRLDEFMVVRVSSVGIRFQKLEAESETLVWMSETCDKLHSIEEQGSSESCRQGRPPRISFSEMT